jgi:hypothetical protein
MLCRLFGHSLYPAVIHLGQHGYAARVWRCRRCDHIEDRE